MTRRKNEGQALIVYAELGTADGDGRDLGGAVSGVGQNDQLGFGLTERDFSEPQAGG